MRDVEFAIIEPMGPPPPLMSSSVPGFTILTYDLGEGICRYQTSVLFMDPFNGDFQAMWPGVFEAKSFMGAVDKHHRVTCSLKRRKGREYRRVAEFCQLRRGFDVDALFGKVKRKAKGA